MGNIETLKPLVSVIMSVYNAEQWLKIAIDSIVNQTYTNWEFFIIDDASTDTTQKILTSYTDNRIKVIFREKQKCPSINLNYAFKLSKGEFIARMDADDISMPDRFQTQVDYLLQHKDVAVVAGFIDLMNDAGDFTGVWKDDRKASSWPKIKSMLPWNCCLAHPSVMFRAEVLKQYMYNEEQPHAEDWEMWLRLAADNRKIEKIPRVLLKYRVHDQSITSTSNKKSAFLKKDLFYKLYFNNKHKGWYNFKVRLGYILNSIKVVLSGIKKKIVS